MPADHKIFPRAQNKIEKSLVKFRSFPIIQIVQKLLSNIGQQSTIVSPQIGGALKSPIGEAKAVIRIAQDFAVFEPSPCMFGSDRKQSFDRPCSILEASELELD